MSSYYEPASMHDLILHTEKEYGALPYVGIWQHDDYRMVTFDEFIADVRKAAAWFIDNGYKDKRIMLFGQNSYEWLVCHVAIAGYVGVCICASKDWKAYDLQQACDVSMPDKIVMSAELELSVATPPGLSTIRFDEVILGAKKLTKQGSYYEKHQRHKDAHSIVIFTTGTTSHPKAVPLSLTNMTAIGASLHSRTDTNCNDRVYLFLPMHHIYSQMCASMATFMVGASIYLAHDMQNHLTHELQKSRPTVISGVPLFFERVLAKIEDADKKKIMRAARILNILHVPVAVRKRIFKKVHEVFGGSLRLLSSGGAPLQPGTKKFFRDMGFTLVEGYGMSEASGVVAVEHMQGGVYGSTGTALDGVDIKIHAPDADGYGELLVRGKSVMDGYFYKGTIDTGCFDKEGYYRTGDCARIDEEGNLFVKGRMDKSIVLSSGENISSREMSSKIKQQVKADKVYLRQREGYLDAIIYTRRQRKAVDTLMEELNETLPKYTQVLHWQVVNDYSVSEMKG